MQLLAIEFDMTGLINRKTLKTLPMRSSAITADIKGFTARTTAVLTYYNDNRREIEGLFVLPLDHTTTIVEFEAIIEGHYMFADVRDSMEVSQKKVLYETESLQDGLFKVSVGKISPWVIAEIQVTIVCEITALFFGDALRYTLPQAFSPKVITTSEEKHTDSISTSTLGYCFNIEIEIEAPCLLYGVQSNTHPIQVDAPPLSQTGAKLVVSIPEDFEPKDEVFELLMFLCRPREPYIVIEEAKRNTEDVLDKNPINSIMNNPILMMSYSPDTSTFKHDPFDSSQSGEYLLLVDCSLSQQMTDIKEACILFLRSLPCNCFFNIISFGAQHHPVFASSQAYSCATLENAVNFVLSIQPTFTSSLLQPSLNWVFDQEELAHIPKQLFIITAATPQLFPSTLQKASNRQHLARCFIFDIATNQCTHALERLAATTRGKYCVVKDDRLQTQLVSCLKAAMQPVITDVNVSWILPDAYDVIYTPENLPSVFFGERLNLYAILASKENMAMTEKPSESINSIKEFWFEDTDLFQEYSGSQNDLLNQYDEEEDTKEREDGNGGEEEEEEEEEDGVTPYNIKQNKCKETTEYDQDNEVFLTEEEVTQLSHDITFPKRSSIDRVRKWRVSKFPQNVDIDTDFMKSDDNYQQCTFQEKEKLYLFQPLRKKTSLDGAESVGSSNSYGSNISSNSHFHAFPGFPTRMSSCRSIEARSPHVPKHGDESFPFQECTNKEKHLSADKLSHGSLGEFDTHENEHRPHEARCSRHKTRQKLTEALMADHVNTHLIDHSNENTIERLLDTVITEKRNKLQEWLKIQEEMTQCLWPITDHEKKEILEKYEWRDSGIGNRSSSEARTSDLEEEMMTLNKKKSSKSSSAFFDIDEPISSDKNTDWKTRSTDAIDDKTWPTRNASSFSHHDNRSQTPKTKPTNTPSMSKRKFKAKSMWNTIIDKVRSIGAIVSEKSGETKFSRKGNASRSTGGISEKEWEKCLPPFETFVNLRSSIVTKVTDEGEQTMKPFFDDGLQTHNQQHLKQNNSKRTLHKPKKGGIRNPPIIENSRTISTSSMYEIGKSDIGDIENLHLLPSHALIYLSGQCGKHAFKRIIPFQLEINSDSEGVSDNDITIHQLAARSIIHDLEMQMEEDDMLENHGKLYIKHLIGEVSKAANVLSKYTTFVTIDDKCNQNEILSTLEYEQGRTENEQKKGNIATSKLLSPFKIQYDKTRNTTSKSASKDDLYQQRMPSYEIVKEPSIPGQPKIRHTRLLLNAPNPSAESNVSPNLVNHKNEHSDSRDLSQYINILQLMSSEGYWKLTQQFAQTLSIKLIQLQESCPFTDYVTKDTNHFSHNIHQDAYENVWTTTIALTWLKCSCDEYQNEWNLIEMKANTWLSKQTLPKGYDLNDIFIVSQQTLKLLKGTSRCSSRSQSLTKS